MLNFAEIQHRVASLTLEILATFTRHHAFLKKARPKLSKTGRPVVIPCWIVYVRKPFPFFSLTPLAQRKEPKETPRIFRACGRDSGLCPKSPQTFEKV
ncbi:MAG: hypothetical protein IJF08_08030 [Clostridia bacterium]|nr:hypothetical protein [Clostridia bacterium]